MLTMDTKGGKQIMVQRIGERGVKEIKINKIK
jgi:hypothetical protein